MTRRVFAALLALVTGLLVAIAVPLGIRAVDHYRGNFIVRATSSATAAAATIEEELSDRPSSSLRLPGGLPRTAALEDGDVLGVFDAAGRPVPLAAPPGGTQAAPAPGAAVAQALAGGTSVRWLPAPRRLQIVIPVRSGATIVGAVALTRDAASVDREAREQWTSLATVALGAAIVTLTISLLLARWIGRPLSRLEERAERLGAVDWRPVPSGMRGPPEVRRLSDAFDRMAARLQALMQGNQAFLADVSHQLRTPLAAMRLRLELLHNDASGAPAAELSATIDEVHRLTRLVDGLLAVARLEQTVSAPCEQPLHLLLPERCAAWRPVADERQITLTVRTPTRLTARATPGHLEQEMDNLLANALNATPACGVITLTATPHQAWARITVADTGPGMSATARERALRRFWSDPPADGERGGDRGGGRGTGLGLAIVHRLVSADGGRLRLQEADSGGLAVVIDLPLADLPPAH